MDIPEYWYYPSVCDFKNNSIAMIQALKGKIPDKENIHNPT